MQNKHFIFKFGNINDSKLTRAKYAMNKYVCSIGVKGNTVRTMVFAQSTTHARLTIEYVFGMTSVVGHPVRAEATTPKTPKQQRLATLRATKEHAAVALDAERKRQQTARAQKVMAAARQPAKPATPSMR